MEELKALQKEEREAQVLLVSVKSIGPLDHKATKANAEAIARKANKFIAAVGKIRTDFTTGIDKVKKVYMDAEKSITGELREEVATLNSRINDYNDALIGVAESQEMEVNRQYDSKEPGTIAEALEVEREKVIGMERIEKIEGARIVEEVIISDVDMIPRAWLIADLSAIKDAMKGGAEVPGCRLVKHSIRTGK